MDKLTRYEGRPEDLSGRLDKEIKVYDFLDGLGIEYYRLDHEPADSDHPQICEAVDEALGARICKNLFLANRQRTRFYMLMIPADKAFRSSDISKQAGRTGIHGEISRYNTGVSKCYGADQRYRQYSAASGG